MDIGGFFGEVTRIVSEFWQGYHTVGVLTGILAFIFAWRKRILGWLLRSRQDYYCALVWRGGVPQGLGKLSKRQQKKRSVSYRIDTSDGLVREVRRVNSAGVLQDDDNGIARWKIIYLDQDASTLV